MPKKYHKTLHFFFFLFFFFHTKDQLTKLKARQWTVLSSAARTFHAMACSYETWRPMVDMQIPPGKYAYPWNTLQHKYNLTKPEKIRRRKPHQHDFFFFFLFNIITCCMIFANSVNNAFLPESSNILSKVTSCKATRVVSNMSSPAWFANMKTGNDCQKKKKKKRHQNHITRTRQFFTSKNIE